MYKYPTDYLIFCMSLCFALINFLYIYVIIDKPYVYGNSLLTSNAYCFEKRNTNNMLDAIKLKTVSYITTQVL